MRLIIDGISKSETKKMLNTQYGKTLWEIINEQRVACPTSKISARLFCLFKGKEKKMRLIIDGISKSETRKMLSAQYGATVWDIVDGKRVTYPTSKITAKLFNANDLENTDKEPVFECLECGAIFHQSESSVHKCL